MNTTDSATAPSLAAADLRSKTARTKSAPIVELDPEYAVMAKALRDADAQVAQYLATLPASEAHTLRNTKLGLRVSTMHAQIKPDDAHGQAALVSARTADAIRKAMDLSANLSANRQKAKEKAAK